MTNHFKFWTKGCYRIFGDEVGNPDKTLKSTWIDANNKCSQESAQMPGWRGATLAIFPNIYYQYFATALSKNLGLDRTIWIGGQSTTQDLTFHWVDGSRMTFTNWLPGADFKIV